MPSLDEKFAACIFIINNLPKQGPINISNEDKLVFYGLFKQGTVGPCTSPQPSIFSVIERYKWSAWRKNGEMDKQEAIEKYIELLLAKIDEVERTYDIKKWLVGDLFELLAPKFSILGKKYYTEEKDITEKQEGKESITPHNEETSTTLFSDTEYCDALEDDQLTRSRASSYELQDSPRLKKRHYMKDYCGRVEAELRNISQQIEKLSLAIGQRHALFLDLVKKKKYTSRLSWSAIFCIFLWPIIVNVLVRYFGKYLLRL